MTRRPIVRDGCRKSGQDTSSLSTRTQRLSRTLGGLQPVQLAATNATARRQGAALPRGPSRGPLYVRNYGAMAIIQPTRDGVTGIQYAQAMDFQSGGRTGILDHFGRYEDVYVRTAEGWRFKSRRFVNESQ